MSNTKSYAVVQKFFPEGMREIIMLYMLYIIFSIYIYNNYYACILFISVLVVYTESTTNQSCFMRVCVCVFINDTASCMMLII